MSFVRLERPVHYGNTGIAFRDSMPPDDPYIFRPENTQDVWSACRTITERYGYDFRDDENGDFLLTTRNNPHVILDLSVDDVGGTDARNPSAYGGTYVILTNTTVTLPATGARLDLVCSRFTGLGSIDFTVTRVLDSEVMATGTVTTADAAAPTGGYHFYDFRSTVDGTNATVATLFSGWFDEYEIELDITGTVWLDCLQLWHTDPMKSLFPSALKTEGNAISVEPKSAAHDFRNYVIVVGRRRAVVADSQKLDRNPENPAGEFVRASAVDAQSVVVPVVNNFYGGTRESIIYDSGITDEDFAEWLARLFIYRYRSPRPNAPIAHTFLPAVRLRDPIAAEESTYGTMDAQTLLWVQGITHRFTTEQGGLKVTTDLETTSYPEYASYEVRQDIDIDKTFYGQPVVNLEVSYTSLDGEPQLNLERGAARISANRLAPDGDVVLLTGQGISTIDLSGQPWPLQPGSVFIKPGASTSSPEVASIPSNFGTPIGVAKKSALGTAVLTGAVTEPTEVRIFGYSGTGFAGSPSTTPNGSWVITKDRQTSRQFYYDWNPQSNAVTVYRTDVGVTTSSSSYFRAEITYQNAGSAYGQGSGWMGNTPYHQFVTVDWDNRRLLVSWQNGDGTAPYAKDFGSCSIAYRALRGDQTTFSDPYSGSCPFYDPYTSELGYLVNFKFDALLSGLYRISVRSCYNDDVVAWLSEPTGNGSDPEAHWQYMTAGAAKRLAWDGSDMVGIWNNRQSQLYAQAAHSAFEIEQKPLVGAGYTVWNREEPVQAGYPVLALISGQLKSTDEPVFGHGTFGEWYIRIEVRNDWIEDKFYELSLDERIRLNVSTPDRRVVETSPIDDNSRKPLDIDGNEYEARIYTHLPRETVRVGTQIRDWTGGSQQNPAIYTESNTGAISNGSNWGLPDNDATIHNEKPVRFRFFIQERPGVLWEDQEDQAQLRLFRHAHVRVNLMDQVIVFEGTNWPGQDIENKRVVNRLLTSDDHTLVFQDADWRKASAFRTNDSAEGFEWIFRPDDFRKDWRGIPDEPIKFGDYLQLEEVPRWDSDRAIAGARSRLQIAFVNYLWYLSAYTQDRSGRFAWCLNTNFVDRSKITQNGTEITWVADPNAQFRRTVVTRQWTNEKVLGSDGVMRLYPDHMVSEWGGGSNDEAIRPLSKIKWREFGAVGNAITGYYTDDYLDFHVDEGNVPGAYSAAVTRQLGKGGSTALGLWTWETNPLFPPNPTRDFHGYYLVPPMVDKQPESVTGVDYRNEFNIIQVDPRSYSNDGNGNVGDDVAAQPTQPLWNSPLRDDTEPAGGTKRFWPGFVVTPNQGREASKNVQANTIDYQRQDNLIHFEELRGIYSRGPRPQELPKYIRPVSPYYQNVYQYNGVSVGRAREQQGLFPLYKAEVVDWFDFTFRREYVWESSRLFPVTQWGAERLDAVNKDYAQVVVALGVNLGNDVRYDEGAWTGWKDDSAGGTLLIGPSSTAPADRSRGSITGVREFAGPPNVFRSPFLPWAVGPKLLYHTGEPNTTDAIFHVVLVNERRSTPV